MPRGESKQILLTLLVRVLSVVWLGRVNLSFAHCHRSTPSLVGLLLHRLFPCPFWLRSFSSWFPFLRCPCAPALVPTPSPPLFAPDALTLAFRSGCTRRRLHSASRLHSPSLPFRVPPALASASVPAALAVASVLRSGCIHHHFDQNSSKNIKSHSLYLCTCNIRVKALALSKTISRHNCKLECVSDQRP